MLQMHEQIDDGLQYCEDCDRFGFEKFCGQCGRRFVGHEYTWRNCPNEECRARVTTEYCPYCGTHVVTDFIRDVEAGTFDWEGLGAVATSKLRAAVGRNPEFGKMIAGKHYTESPDVMKAIEATWGVKEAEE